MDAIWGMVLCRYAGISVLSTESDPAPRGQISSFGKFRLRSRLWNVAHGLHWAAGNSIIEG